MTPIGSIYYFSSILVVSKWQKFEESTCKVILVLGNSLENWGLEPSKVIFEALNDIFGNSSVWNLHAHA
jgi:hypothetical protein